MDSRFLKFFVLFYAYNKYSERHCGIYLRFTCIFGDISRVGTDAKKTTLKNMCKTRWVERHETYEVFFALFSCIMRALEVMANERLFAGQYGDAAWSWDTDTKNKASELANAISSFSFLITLLTAMKCLSVLKPLSVKLQKRDLDVYEAYTNSNNVTDDLQDIRDNIEDIWTEWFDPGGGYSHTLPIRVCVAQRGRDFEAPDLEPGIHFRVVF